MSSSLREILGQFALELLMATVIHALTPYLEDKCFYETLYEIAATPTYGASL